MTTEFQTIDEARAALRQAEAALERARQREVDLFHETNQRLTELAHEIKTPLNAMLGYTQVLAAETLGPMGKPEYADYSRTVYEASLHLQDICDGILDLDKPADRSGVEVEDVDVRDVIGGVVKLFAHMAEERGVRLASNVADGFPKLRTDPKRLNQIMINLVSNGIKFTPRGGSVSVEAELDAKKGAVILVVSDTGQGICAARLKDMLKPYARGSRGSPHGDEGVGLGLSVASRLAAELGGELLLSSQKDAGTVASISLPLIDDHFRSSVNHAEITREASSAAAMPSYLNLHRAGPR